MNDAHSAYDLSGKKLVLDPDKMDDLAKKFLKDADDFDGQVGPIRQAMSNGPTVWNSASQIPALKAVLDTHRTKMRDADKFMAAITEDLSIMSRNTSFLRHTLLGEDHGNGDLLKQMIGKLPSEREGAQPRSEGQ